MQADTGYNRTHAYEQAIQLAQAHALEEAQVSPNKQESENNLVQQRGQELIDWLRSDEGRAGLRLLIAAKATIALHGDGISSTICLTGQGMIQRWSSYTGEISLITVEEVLESTRTRDLVQLIRDYLDQIVADQHSYLGPALREQVTALTHFMKTGYAIESVSALKKSNKEIALYEGPVHDGINAWDSIVLTGEGFVRYLGPEPGGAKCVPSLISVEDVVRFTGAADLVQIIKDGFKRSIAESKRGEK